MRRIAICLLFTFTFLNGKAQVIFSTDFDSGSLGSYRLVDSIWFKVSDTDSTQYLSYVVSSQSDPLNPIDSSLTPSARWIYFRMTGVKDKQLVLNFKGTDPLRPVYSYDKANFLRFAESAAPRSGSWSRRTAEAEWPRYLFSQRFTQDTVYIAYFVPYSYSFLQERIKSWSQHPWVRLDTIGYSRKGLPLQMLSISDSSIPDSQKKSVWMHGRVHTSETPASWHLDGFIEALVSDTPHAASYRKSIKFYIVPFANPDGVFEGLSRSNSSGVNIEINWGRPTEDTEPEVLALKKTMEALTINRPFDMLLNMHSQVANQSAYWVHTAASTSDHFYKNELKLCFLTMFESPYLKKNDLEFSDVANRYAEGWSWNRAGEKTMAISLETPYTYYGNPSLWVTPENLKDFGAKTLNTVGDYFGLSTPDRIYVSNRDAKAGGSWSKTDYLASTISPELVLMDDLLIQAKKKGSKISYQVKNLTPGTYKIYRWFPGSTKDYKNNEVNIWKPIAYHTQEQPGVFKLRLKASQEGELFDALLLVREE